MGKPKDVNIKSVFEKCGVNLEVTTEWLLKDNGWSVDTNIFFSDPYSNIPREIDIVAHKIHPFCTDNYFNNPFDFDFRLFIECKYIQENIRIWLYTRPLDPEKIVKALKGIELYNDIASFSNWRDEDGSFFATFSEHRFFSINEIAYQSTDNQKDRGFGIPWVQQIAHAMMSNRFVYNTHAKYGVSYGIIVVNDMSRITLWMWDWSYKILNSSTLFELDYIDNKNNPKYILVQIVPIDELSKFLTSLDDEVNKLYRYLITMERYRNP